MPPVGTPEIDFIRWRWLALSASAVLIAAGVALVVARGLPLGLEFTGGTLLVVEFERPEVSESQVRQALAVLPGEAGVQQYGSAADRRMLIRVGPTGADDSLDATAHEVAQALREADLPSFEVVNRELVSAGVGDELQRQGLFAALASMAGVGAYIAARHRVSFGVGATVATVHDLLVTLACLMLAGYDLTLHVVAALLTIAGYSVNDTIVVFDRLRENARTMAREPPERIVNLSITQTMSRTLTTSTTTCLAVLSLFVFGGDVLRGFAFTMLAGVVIGTCSTIFIAAPIALLMRGAARTLNPEP